MKKAILIILALVLMSSCVTMLMANESPLPPTLSLGVNVNAASKLNVTYIAKLSYLPPIFSNAVAINFYCNGQRIARANIDLKTLTAVYQFSQTPGKYQAIAALEDTPQPVKSNPMAYLVQ